MSCLNYMEGTNRADLTGHSSGMVTVVCFSHSSKNRAYWMARCECGTVRHYEAYRLRHNKVKCCGCLLKNRVRKPPKIRTKTYISWQAMIGRCLRKTDSSYIYYGAKGIRVCKRWLKFKNFLEDMGERPQGKSLDRFPFNVKIYSKKTCRWATPRQQVLNQKKRGNNKYRGVRKIHNKWVAYLCLYKKGKYLGSFSTEKEAAIKYNEAAIEAFGNDANLNKV